MPRLEEFITLCKVIELRSFSRAAEILNISQPAVSQQVKSLEAEYSTVLLHREGTEILPTEQGRVIYEYACQLVEMYERSRKDILAMDGLVEGRLQLGGSTGPGELLLPLMMGKFKSLHPKVELALRVADSNDIIQGVFNRNFELGFVGTYRRDRNLSFETFLRDELVLVVNPSHPWAKCASMPYEELLKAPLILQQQGSGATTILQDALKEQGLSLRELNIVMEVGLQESTKTAVRAGYGATIISRLGVQEELERGVLKQVPIDHLKLNRDIYVCYYRTAPLSNLAQTFLDFCYQHKQILFAGDQAGKIK